VLGVYDNDLILGIAIVIAHARMTILRLIHSRFSHFQ